ncbi:hypothetical protein [Clostridium sp.]|jgi:hypothetical protein|uniref:hypothetical protein n=1 Tax=Clostridium sp. TaxID=1506 RepID=UPI0025BD40C7|nr:hypothetical protein [Clostridium sp.]MCI9070216.1 hypothetical protein [Clostridium sp.]
MERLNRKNFFSPNEDYEEFEKYINKIGLDIDCFYITGDSLINQAWYIEGYNTIPIHILSIEYLEFSKIKEMVQKRKELIEAMKNKKNYTRLFALLDKPFRIMYFLELYEHLEDHEFLKLFEFVWSTCEYNFNLLIRKDMIQRLESLKDIEKIKNNLINNTNNGVVTIYRGEADESTSFNDGAISWTIDYNIASFFAHRFRAKNPKIYKANVLIDDVIMFIERESEVLVKKESLFNITIM